MRFFKDMFRSESSQDKFARISLHSLKANGWARQVEYDSEKFEFRYPNQDGELAVTYLGNPYREWLTATDTEKDRVIQNFVCFIFEADSDLPIDDDALTHLLPILRSRADSLTDLGQPGDTFNYAHTTRHFCDNMLLMLAIDLEHGIAHLTDSKMNELGVSFEECLGVATTNLLDRGNHKFRELEMGVFASNCEDMYDASRILLHDIILRLPINGNPVAILLSRSCLLITGSEYKHGLARIAEIALENLPDEDRAIAAAPIELFDGKWRSFSVTIDHPPQLQRLLNYQQLWNYSSTKELLQELVGQDIYVASFCTIEDGGQSDSFATWAFSIPTLIPKVNAIVIEINDSGSRITKKFDDVNAVCGPFDLFEETEFPPRYRLPDIISIDQLAALQNQYPEYKFFES